MSRFLHFALKSKIFRESCLHFFFFTIFFYYKEILSHYLIPLTQELNEDWSVYSTVELSQQDKEL